MRWGFCRVWKFPFYECISVRVVVMKKLSSCKGIIAVILFSLILTCFAGCHLWYQDLKGYLEHWTDTVQVKDFVVLSSPESQKNSSGFETISTYASVTATVNIINPENHSLDAGVGFAEDTLRSVRISGAAGSAVLPLTTVTSASPTSMEVQLDPLTQVLTKESLALEHTNFTVTFVPTRAENGLSALGAQNITLRYNTPPRLPLEVVYDKVTGKLGWMKSEQDRWEVVQGSGKDLDDLIFWAWPSGITDPRHPDYVEKFEVYEDGVLFDSDTASEFLMSHELALQSYIPQEIKAAGYDVYCSLGTSGTEISVYAIDGEGVKSLAAVSGKAPYRIILDANGGLFPSVGTTSVETYKAERSLIIGSDLEVPFRDGYFLSGWSSSDGRAISFPLSIDQPMTLTAQWQANPPASSGSGGGTTVSTYTITYNDNGATSGTVPGTQNKIAGRAVTVAQNSGSLTKTGYTFNGWNTAANGSGTSYTAGSNYTDDTNVTLYAQWKANTYTATLSGGTGGSTSVTVTYDKTPPSITPPSRPGFTFKGYNTKQDGTGIDYYDGNGVGVGTWQEIQDTTLYAQWETNPGTVVCEGIIKNGVKLEKTSEVQIISTPVDIASLSKANVSSDVFIPGRSGTIQPFVMGQYEVTQELYETVMGQWSGDKPQGKYGEGPYHPAYFVSWYDAVVFCNRLSVLMGLNPVYSKNNQTDPDQWGTIPSTSTSDTSEWDAINCNWDANGYRLPTEAEWELAARGGTPTLPGWSYTYAGSNTINDVAWSGSNASLTREVGQKAANGLNLYDMSGNVCEWCWDWKGNVIDSTPLFGGELVDARRIRRGGSWYHIDARSTVFDRGDSSPVSQSEWIGFRVVRSAN